MLRKVTLALVAAASLSVMALAPTSASAGGVFIWPHKPSSPSLGHHGHGFGVGFVGGGYNGCYVTRRVLTPLRLPLADGERLLLIRPQVPSEAPVAHAAGVFRCDCQAGGPPPPPCKRQSDATGSGSNQLPNSESPRPAASNERKTGKMAEIGVRFGAFLPNRPFRLRYPACPNPRILMPRACRYVRGPAARFLFLIPRRRREWLKVR